MSILPSRKLKGKSMNIFYFYHQLIENVSYNLDRLKDNKIVVTHKLWSNDTDFLVQNQVNVSPFPTVIL